MLYFFCDQPVARGAVLPLLLLALVGCADQSNPLQLPVQVVSELKPDMQRTVKTGASIQFSHQLAATLADGRVQLELQLVSWHQLADLAIGYQVSPGVELISGALEITDARAGFAYPLVFAFSTLSYPVDIQLQVTAHLQQGGLDRQQYGLRLQEQPAASSAVQETDSVLPAQIRVHTRQPE